MTTISLEKNTNCIEINNGFCIEINKIINKLHKRTQKATAIVKLVKSEN